MFEEFFKEIKARDIVLNYAKVIQNDNVLLDYSRLESKTRLNTWSLCKSIVACGIGIAINEGYLSLDEKLIDSFPEYQKDDLSPSLRTLTLRHMLTMSTGMENAMFFGDDQERYETDDWVSYFFAHKFPDANGQRFLYSNFNTYMMAVWFNRKTGRDFLDYMKEKMFTPLGIRNPDWTRCPKGYIHAANGLYLTVDEIAKFGMTLLNEGSYNGLQIVPKEFLKEAVTNQYPPEAGVEYGYHFWIDSASHAFSANGKFGQYCIVIPEKNAVVVTMALDSEDYYDLIRDHIIHDL